MGILKMKCGDNKQDDYPLLTDLKLYDTSHTSRGLFVANGGKICN